MIEDLLLLKDTPVPGLLIIGGIIFLLLAFIGKFTEHISVHPLLRWIAGVVGALFILSGVYLYIVPANTLGSDSIVAVQTIITDTPNFVIQSTPTPRPGVANATATPVPRVIGHETIVERGARQVSLAEGELIAGTADRFTDVIDEFDPPCTAFVIRGPLEQNIEIAWGGWDYWGDVYDDDLVQNLLQNKITDLMRHETCPSRGIRTHECTGTLCSTALLPTE